MNKMSLQLSFLHNPSGDMTHLHHMMRAESAERWNSAAEMTVEDGDAIQSNWEQPSRELGGFTSTDEDWAFEARSSRSACLFEWHLFNTQTEKVEPTGSVLLCTNLQPTTSLSYSLQASQLCC